MKLMILKLLVTAVALFAAHLAIRKAKALLIEAEKRLYRDPATSLSLISQVDDQVPDSTLVKAGLADLRSALLATARANLCYS